MEAPNASNCSISSRCPDPLEASLAASKTLVQDQKRKTFNMSSVFLGM